MSSDRLRVYIAGPLSGSGDREANVRKAVEAGKACIKHGLAPLIPHLTHYVDPDDSLTHQVWLDVDLPWVSVADAVLRLPGESKGADMEVERATEVGVPVFFSMHDLLKAAGARGWLVPGGRWVDGDYRQPNQARTARPGDPRFHALLKEIASLHDKKQADYGRDQDPFANVRAADEFGIPAWVGAILRANDKMHRIKSFLLNGKLKNESLEDSLMDGAVYHLIALILFRELTAKSAA